MGEPGDLARHPILQTLQKSLFCFSHIPETAIKSWCVRNLGQRSELSLSSKVLRHDITLHAETAFAQGI